MLNANKVLQQQSVDHCMPCETLPGAPALSRMLLQLGEHWPSCTELLHSLNTAQNYILTSKYDKHWQYTADLLNSDLFLYQQQQKSASLVYSM